MVIKRLFGSGKEERVGEEEDYMELDMEDDKGTKNVVIQVDRLSDFADCERVIKKVRDGSIVLLKIKDLKSKDIGELKRSIEKIRKTCMALDGDIAGVGEELLVITPKFAKIQRDAE